MEYSGLKFDHFVQQLKWFLLSSTIYIYSQNFYFRLSPPNIRVEYKFICITPMSGVLFNCFISDNSLRHTMFPWIIPVRFNQQWCPVEINRNIVLLKCIVNIYRLASKLFLFYLNLRVTSMHLLYHVILYIYT